MIVPVYLKSPNVHISICQGRLHAVMPAGGKFMVPRADLEAQHVLRFSPKRAAEARFARS